MPSPRCVAIRVPATTANLGPGFDCLGMAMELWNDVSFIVEGERLKVHIEGEGKEILPRDESNLIVRAAQKLLATQKQQISGGLCISCYNRIPLSSGLGSSASAVLAGLLGANALLGCPLNHEQILRLGCEMEGHPDNISAALLGGLVVTVTTEKEITTRRFDVPPLLAVVVVPTFDLSTRTARTILPKKLPLADAVFNLGRTTLVVEALRAGDLELLSRVMDDRLHQPYRLERIPGSRAALQAAKRAGAAAVALSGAGPGLVAFSDGSAPMAISDAMLRALQDAGISARSFFLRASASGASVSITM
ncbi:MAG: homoserine kinase [Anaerolineae bacterium]|nr:homoserine kinase [Anaerolineae bacterium]